MFYISSSTTLFGNTPQKDFNDDHLDDYRNEISQNWTLTPVVNEIPEEIEKEPIKPQKISTRPPKKHTEIIKGSAGSKLFSMLQNIEPSTRTTMNTPQVKSSDSRPPPRKLRFSS